MASFEKTPTAEQLDAPESRNTIEKDLSLPSAATEAVLAEIDRAHRAHRVGYSHNREEIAHLNGSIHSCECGKLFDEYVQGSVPTFERMFGSLPERVEEASRDLRKDAERYGPEDVEEETRMLSLLKGRERQVQTAVQMYVQSVIRFDTLKQLSHGGAREDKENFANADHARRRLHNALLESLHVYLETAQEAERMGVFSGAHPGPIFTLWDIGIDARSISHEQLLLFSERTLERREFVRDWAIAAFFAMRLGELSSSSGASASE